MKTKVTATGIEFSLNGKKVGFLQELNFEAEGTDDEVAEQLAQLTVGLFGVAPAPALPAPAPKKPRRQRRSKP